MFHVVQNNLSSEREFDRMLDALVGAGVQTYAIVKVVPFLHEVMPDIKPEGDVCVWGCHTMCTVAKEKGWAPGAFINDNFDMRVTHEKLGAHNVLNGDGVFTTFGDAPEHFGDAEQKFIRPVYDDKSFTGAVVHREQYQSWVAKVAAIEDSFTTLKGNTPVLIADVKPLDCEARFFVVDGKVVTGSTYRVFGNQVRKRIDSTNAMGMPMMEFAQQMVYRWQPDRAFVIDVALTGGECKVIEINCLNASGFYDCDMTAVVKALENL